MKPYNADLHDHTSFTKIQSGMTYRTVYIKQGSYLSSYVLVVTELQYDKLDVNL